MKRPGFNQVVWMIAIVAIVYLVAAPLSMDLWAARSWKEVPAQLGSGGRYIYEYGNDRFESTRRDFWQLMIPHQKIPKSSTPLNINGTCWVNPSDPLEAVLFLDAHKNWTNSLSRLSAAGFLLVCVAGVLHFGLKRRVPA